MDVVRWRAFRSATEWKGHAAQVARRPGPRRPRHPRTLADDRRHNVDRSASGTNDYTAASSRRSGLRAWRRISRLSRTVVSVRCRVVSQLSRPPTQLIGCHALSMVATQVCEVDGCAYSGDLGELESTRLAQARLLHRARIRHCGSASPAGAATALTRIVFAPVSLQVVSRR